MAAAFAALKRNEPMKRKMAKNKRKSILFAAFLLTLLFTLAQCEKETPRPTAEKPKANQEKATREVIDYHITIRTDKPKSAIKRINLAISEQQGKGELKEGAESEIFIPRENYLEFTAFLQKLGKLSLRREKKQSPTPPDSPIRFLLKVEKKSSGL